MLLKISEGIIKKNLSSKACTNERKIYRDFDAENDTETSLKTNIVTEYLQKFVKNTFMYKENILILHQVYKMP